MHSFTLDPIGFYKSGRPIYPICGGSEGAPEGGGEGAGGTAPDGTPSSDRGFPEGTPVASMKPDEQVAYWKHQARRHEERAKTFDGLTPEAFAELRTKAERHDALEHEMLSDKEKAVLEAQKAATAETLKSVTPKLVAAEFKAAASGRIEAERLKEILEPLDLSKFLTAKGDVDEAKVASYVEGIAPAAPGPRRGPSSVGLGNRQHSGGNPGDQGRAMAAKRFGTSV